jgi:mannose-1-phosphate guanylyltransferase
VKFDAILLAAGFGTRLKPLTDVLPKCLVPIHGRPLIDYWLEPLVEAGAERILVNTHYKADLVTRYLQLTPWWDKITVVYEETLLGTAGTLIANASFVGDRPCLLAHADNLSIFSIADFINAHEQRPARAVITMMTFNAHDPQACGIVAVDENGLVIEFHEKVQDPPGSLANGAVFVVDRELFLEISTMPLPVTEISTDVLPHLLGRISTWPNDGYHRDIGTPSSYAEAHLEVAETNPSEVAAARWLTFLTTLTPPEQMVISEARTSQTR